MTSSVWPPFSSKVTVVTGPPSPPSSLVHTRRECGITSRSVPKNATPSGSNSRRYLPPTRTSISQERRDMPIEVGTHHRLNSSGLVHASNTMRAGLLKVRVTTCSCSDFRSTVVRFFVGAGSPSLLASINLLLPFEFLDDLSSSSNRFLRLLGDERLRSTHKRQPPGDSRAIVWLRLAAWDS